MYRVALNTPIAWNRREERHERGKQPLEGAAGVLNASSPESGDPRVEWLYRQIRRTQ
jgi:RNA polymerase sigma-70 factor, ECF subfamily